MKRTFWKKALTVALSAALAVSVGSVAFADETVTPENSNETIATSEPPGAPVALQDVAETGRLVIQHLDALTICADPIDILLLIDHSPKHT